MSSTLAKKKKKRTRDKASKCKQLKRRPSLVKKRPASHSKASHTDVVYCLNNGQHSYIGVTNDMKRRLRQHNGELRGGARYTTAMKKVAGVPWNIAFLVTGFPTRSDALKLEWRLHGHVKVDSYARNPFGSLPVERRAWQLQAALLLERTTRTATPTCQIPLRLYWHDPVHYTTAVERVRWPANVTHILVAY
jgi:predicted GIY-YIG superfamily endonuclease